MEDKKRHSKKGTRRREKLDAEINNLRKYQDRLKLIKSGRATLVQQSGKGLVFYNKPEELLDRLELLGLWCIYFVFERQKGTPFFGSLTPKKTWS